MGSRSRYLRTVLACLIGVFAFNPSGLTQPPQPGRGGEARILIVGAGISGLSAALEAARRGGEVTVIEMSSVFGGHAVVSGGAVCIVDTPLQRSQGIEDSPGLAFTDFVQWGEDSDPNWVRYYVNNSRREIYDWLTEMGVSFSTAIPHDGNSVPRLHMTHGKGLALVSPIYRRCLQNANITFTWNTRAEDLLVENGRVVGVAGRNLRTGVIREFRGKAVILATGGFQSNLSMVLRNWPSERLPVPDRLLLGAGRNAVGLGHELAAEAGAALSRLDHQWNYAIGLPDPRESAQPRGLAVFIPASIWVNRQGRRFVNEFAGAKESLPAVLAQEGMSYWSVFDEDGKKSLKVNLPGWDAERTENEIISQPGLVKSAASLDELAKEIKVSPSALVDTVREWNRMIETGKDADFGRFDAKTRSRAAKIQRPPFYAAAFFPITRKSMGGISVDASCRVLDRKGNAVPGLYAVGELSGFGGINGRAALEGTFLGPAIVMGRVAARHATDLPSTGAANSAPARLFPMGASEFSLPNESCTGCHDLQTELQTTRRGYWHFEHSHRVIAQGEYECRSCHVELSADPSVSHTIDPLAHVETCAHCHSAR